MIYSYEVYCGEKFLCYYKCEERLLPGQPVKIEYDVNGDGPLEILMTGEPIANVTVRHTVTCEVVPIYEHRYGAPCHIWDKLEVIG